MEGCGKMLFSKILIAYDGSELAQKALEKAIEIAEVDPTIKLEVVHVITVPTALSNTDSLQALEDAIYQEGEDMIAKLELALSKISSQSSAILLKGRSPAYVLLHHAKEHDCDLIIMGSRGLTGIKEFLGSVSHTVVQRSQIPVLIVK